MCRPGRCKDVHAGWATTNGRTGYSQCPQVSARVGFNCPRKNSATNPSLRDPGRPEIIFSGGIPCRPLLRTARWGRLSGRAMPAGFAVLVGRARLARACRARCRGCHPGSLCTHCPLPAAANPHMIAPCQVAWQLVVGIRGFYNAACAWQRTADASVCAACMRARVRARSGVCLRLNRLF